MSSNHTVEIRITAENLSSAAFQRVVADLKGMGTAADVATRELSDVGQAARKAGTDLKTVESGATSAASSMRRIVETAAGVRLAGMIENAPELMLQFGRASFDAASAYEESMSRVEVVFGNAADSIQDFAETATETLGVSESAALSAAGEFGNLFTSMGMAQQPAADMSRTLVQLAADLASFNNISVAEAIDKLQAGLVGETEPLRSLGVNLNAATVQALALEMGLADTAKALTAADKAQASYQLILQQTANSQGDFQRTSDGAANSLKELDASVQDLQVTIGQGLTPAIADFSQQVSGSVQELTGWIEHIRAADHAAADFAGTIGIGNNSSVIGSTLGFALGQAKDGAESLFYTLVPGAAVVHEVESAVDSAASVFGLFGGGADEASSALARFVTATTDSLQPANLFQQTMQDLTLAMDDVAAAQERLFASGAQDYATDLERLARNGRDAQMAQNEYADALGRAAEFAGEANEANSDYFLGLEIGSGHAAEMAFHVAKVAEAQQLLADAYQSGLQGMATFNQQSSEYAGIQSTLEKGYDEIIAKQEDNQKLTEEEQLLLERYPQLYGRLEGAQQDATIQAALFAAANAEVMIAQDELNAAIMRGEENLDPYIQRLNDAKTLTGDQAYADPMISSLNTLTGTVTTVLIPAILDMTRHIEYIAKPWLVEIDAATEAAEAELLRILGLINQINSSSAAPYMPGAGDPGGGQAFAEGGIVSGPQLALIGEAGPELVLPLSKPGRMRELLKQAGIVALAEGGGAGFGSSPGGNRNGIIINISALVQPIDWNFLFAGIDDAAEDWGAQAGQQFIKFFDGSIEDLASGEMLADARAELEDLFTIRAIAVESSAPAAVIAEIDAEIRALSDEVNAIGAAMGTTIVQGIADSLASGEAAALLAEFRQSIFDGLDLADIADEQVDLQESIAHLTALRDAAAELGDAATADVLTAQLQELAAELALVTQIAGTDAVVAWLAEQEAMAAAAEHAELLKKKHEDLLALYEQIVVGLSQGGDAAGSFVDRLIEDFDEAEAALDWARVIGLPPEVIASLEADFATAEAAMEQGAFALHEALAAGLLDEETLRALAEAGGAWFEELYNGVFGPGSFDAWESGWNDLSDETLDQIRRLIPELEDGGAELMDALVEAVTDGAMSYEEALGLLSDATGEEVNAIIAELERLEAALTVQLAEALLAGMTDLAADLEGQLAIIGQLLDALADRAVDVSRPSGGGTPTTIGGSKPSNSLIDLIGASESNPMLIEAMVDRVHDLADALRDVQDGGTLAAESVDLLDTNLDGMIQQNEVVSGFAWLDELQGALIKTGHLADEVWEHMTPPESVIQSFEELIATAAGFTVDSSHLSDLIREAVGDLSETFADEQLALLRDITNNPELYGGEAAAAALAEHVAAALAVSLDELGIASDQLSFIEGQLAEAGVSPLEGLPELLASSMTQAITDSAAIQGQIIGEHVERAVLSAMGGQGGIERAMERGLSVGWTKIQNGAKPATVLVGV